MVLRDAQLKVFGEALRRQFVRRAAAHLAQHLPKAAAMPAPELRAFVERNTAALEKRGFVAENDLVKLLSVLVVWGEDLFEKKAWAKSLASGGAGATLRANRVFERAVRELRKGKKTEAA